MLSDIISSGCNDQKSSFNSVVLKQQSGPVGPGPAQMHQIQNSLGNNWNSSVVSVPSIQQQQPPPATIPSIPNLNTANIAREIENVVAQQNVLRDQIRQSEQNLSAQHGVNVPLPFLPIKSIHICDLIYFAGTYAAATEANRRCGGEGSMGHGSEAIGREWSSTH